LEIHHHHYYQRPAAVVVVVVVVQRSVATDGGVGIGEFNVVQRQTDK
jgi:hypothetical protein